MECSSSEHWCCKVMFVTFDGQKRLAKCILGKFAQSISPQLYKPMGMNFEFV